MGLKTKTKNSQAKMQINNFKITLKMKRRMRQVVKVLAHRYSRTTNRLRMMISKCKKQERRKKKGLSKNSRRHSIKRRQKMLDKEIMPGAEVVGGPEVKLHLFRKIQRIKMRNNKILK